MAEGRRHRSRPFPAVLLEFGGGGVNTLTRERIAVAKGQHGDAALPSTVRTSGVEPLRKILTAAAQRHADLNREIADYEAALTRLRARLRVAQLFVVRLLLGDHIRRLAEQGQSAIAGLARAGAEREAGRVEVYFAIDTATAAAYAALTRAFEDLAAYGRVWDAGVSTAEGEGGRVPVVFSVGASDIVTCREDVLLAPFSGGAALQILPGFILLREAADAIVVEHGGIQMEVTRTRFVVEDEALPRDARVVGEAWPDEEPDADAKHAATPLPVVEYGQMTLRAPRGLLRVFVFSNWTKAQVFVEAYEQYRRTLAAIVEPDVEPGDIEPRGDLIPAEPPLDLKPRAWLALDWLAIFVLGVLLALPFAPRRTAPTQSAPPPAAAPAATSAEASRDRSAVRPRPKPKRVARQAPPPHAKPGEPCGLVRQPDSVLKLVPCPPAAPTQP